MSEQPTGMRKVADLDVGSYDAINYQSNQGKEFLKRVFFRDQYLDSVISPGRMFLIGEKGTGKTAYATFLSNEEYGQTASSTVVTGTTDYRKFFALKTGGHLPVSDFVDTWKTILLLLVAEHITRNEKPGFAFSDRFKSLRASIDKYYNSAFDPQVAKAIEFVRDAEVTAALMANGSGVSAREKDTETEKSSKFQNSLYSVERQIRDAISSLKLSKNHIVFIDGIDVRPGELEFDDYITIVRGLANAVWDLNQDFFSRIKDSPGRIKVVMLVRPDIFDSVEFQNANAKIKDNSVVLDWKTTYDNYRSSRIFALIDGILAKQQGHPALPVGAAWDHYFNYDVPNMRIAEKVDNPFVTLLRSSFYRPRDIIAYVDIMKEYVAQHRKDAESFVDDDYIASQQDYSTYLLGEVKDQLSFYYSGSDFAQIKDFFKFLQGRGRFSWGQFQAAYRRFTKTLEGKNVTLEALQGEPEQFLQFLYSMNVIGYEEKAEFGTGMFVHWSFRDRSAVNLSPQVAVNYQGFPYIIHLGLLRALKLGGGGSKGDQPKSKRRWRRPTPTPASK